MSATTYPSDYTLKDCLRDLLKSREAVINDVTISLTLLAKCIRGNVKHRMNCWCVWRRTQVFSDGRLDFSDTYIELLRLTRLSDEKAWQVKTFFEEDGPIYHNCPIKYLAMARPTSYSWREEVFAQYVTAKFYRTLNARKKQ